MSASTILCILQSVSGLQHFCAPKTRNQQNMKRRVEQQTDDKARKRTKILTTLNNMNHPEFNQVHVSSLDMPDDIIPIILSHLPLASIWYGPLTVNKQWFNSCKLIWKMMDMEEKEKALCYACERGHTEMVQFWLNECGGGGANVDPSCHDNYCIRVASQNGHTEIVKLLLSDLFVDPTTHDNLPIRLASLHGHTEVVKLLLSDLQVDPSAHNNSAIHDASENGYAEIVQLLLQDSRLNLNVRKNYAFFLAAKNGHIDIVRILLNDARVDPSRVNQFGRTALDLAIGNNHANIVKLLLNDSRVQLRNVNAAISDSITKCFGFKMEK